MVLDKPLSNLQIELLKVFSHDLSSEDLLQVKRILARFFADRASDAFDELWDEKGWSDDTMDEWLAGR